MSTRWVFHFSPLDLQVDSILHTYLIYARDLEGRSRNGLVLDSQVVPTKMLVICVDAYAQATTTTTSSVHTCHK